MKNLNIIESQQGAEHPAGIHNRIRHELTSTGYVILKNFLGHEQPSKESFLNFCAGIAPPVAHDHQGALVWDIKCRAGKLSGFATFSEHNDEASLHTDSQYRLKPETFFSLFCIKKAQCGGGTSSLLSLKHILLDLSKTKKGRNAIQALSREKFKLLIPSVFRSHSNAPDFISGLILEKDKIRFRADTIERALELYPGANSAAAITAYHYLKLVIKNSVHILKFDLEDGDMIFINNTTMLHGREAFSDTERHLLRVRMNYSWR